VDCELSGAKINSVSFPSKTTWCVFVRSEEALVLLLDEELLDEELDDELLEEELLYEELDDELLDEELLDEELDEELLLDEPVWRLVRI